MNLRKVSTAQDDIYGPTARLVAALQQERHLSVQLIGENDPRVATLWSQRKETDRAIDAFRDGANSDIAKDNAAVTRRIDNALAKLPDLEDGRAAIDNGAATRSQTAATYSAIIDDALPIFQAMPANKEPSVTKAQETLAAVQRFREVLTRGNTLLAGAVAEGRLEADDRDQFNELVAVRQFLMADIGASLNASQQRDFNELVSEGSFAQLRGYEEEIAEQDIDDTRLPFTDAAWAQVRSGVLTGLADLENDLVDQMVERSNSEATSVLVQAALVTVAVMFIGMMLTIVWFRVAPRHVLHELTTLKETALEFALNRLPSVVAKLQRGEQVDVQAEVPPLESGKDEFGEVSRAFNSVRQVAVQAAVDQAELRNGIRDVFVNLARRSQGLVHRQLSLLDKMERDTNDPEDLEKLFAIDHLATRLRRHAEDLIILSGSAPGRQWRKPVPMVDVIRSAVGEIESYNRVSVLRTDQAQLSGRIVADVIPLLSALIDNATQYSPPQTKVRVAGATVPNGFVIEIEDSGLGMTDQELTKFNQQLSQRPEFHLSDTVQLGLFVVAQLAHRHNIKVSLRRSPYGGTTAIVLIPSTLLAAGGAPITESTTTTGPLPRRAEPPADIEAEPVSPAVPPESDPIEPIALPMRVAKVNLAEPPAPAEPFVDPEEPAEAEAETGADEASLPRRERQASLAEELRNVPPEQREPELIEEEEELPPAPQRTPEQIRSLMSTFQRGSVQGERAADALDLPPIDPAAPPPDSLQDAQR